MASGCLGKIVKGVIGLTVLTFTVVAGIFGLAAYNGYRYETSGKETLRAKVTGTSIVTKDGESVFIIHTDKETFANFNDPLKSKFSEAADLQGRVYKDSTYNFTVYGVRSKAFDLYRNVLKAEAAK